MMTILFAKILQQGLWSVLTLSLLASVAHAQAVQQAAPQSSQLDVEPVNIREYTVELIIFEYADGAAGTTEIFLPDEPETPYFGDTLDPERNSRANGEFSADPSMPATMNEDSANAGAPTPAVLAEISTLGRSGFVPVPASEQRLTSTYQRLSRLDAYRPLMHVAWRQPTLEEQFSVPIKLRRLGNPPLRLDGTVNLYLSRFLHLVIDLSLEDRTAQRVPGGNDRLRNSGDLDNGRFGFEPGAVARSVFYRINEDRIVKNGELRYFDHPKFGVIARIDRAEKTASGAQDDTGVLLPPND
jgi:hypothetical protein